MTVIQRAQRKLWQFLYPVFPRLERLARFFKKSPRQNYVLGQLHPERSLDDFCDHLRRWGFEHVVVAWTDDGQVLSWRKSISFERQYHLRVFEDGEVRGHYEYSPEAAPLWHLLQIGQEKRAADFRRFLEGHVVHSE